MLYFVHIIYSSFNLCYLTLLRILCSSYFPLIRYSYRKCLIGLYIIRAPILHFAALVFNLGLHNGKERINKYLRAYLTEMEIDFTLASG